MKLIESCLREAGAAGPKLDAPSMPTKTWARQRDAVVHDIWTVFLNRPDVCCFHLGSAATVYLSQYSHGASFFVRAQHGLPEIAILQRSRIEAVDVFTFLVHLKHGLRLMEDHMFA